MVRRSGTSVAELKSKLLKKAAANAFMDPDDDLRNSKKHCSEARSTKAVKPPADTMEEPNAGLENSFFVRDGRRFAEVKAGQVLPTDALGTGLAIVYALVGGRVDTCAADRFLDRISYQLLLVAQEKDNSSNSRRASNTYNRLFRRELLTVASAGLGLSAVSGHKLCVSALVPALVNRWKQTDDMVHLLRPLGSYYHHGDYAVVDSFVRQMIASADKSTRKRMMHTLEILQCFHDSLLPLPVVLPSLSTASFFYRTLHLAASRKQTLNTSVVSTAIVAQLAAGRYLNALKMCTDVLKRDGGTSELIELFVVVILKTVAATSHTSSISHTDELLDLFEWLCSRNMDAETSAVVSEAVIAECCRTRSFTRVAYALTDALKIDAVPTASCLNVTALLQINEQHLYSSFSRNKRRPNYFDTPVELEFSDPSCTSVLDQSNTKYVCEAFGYQLVSVLGSDGNKSDASISGSYVTNVHHQTSSRTSSAGHFSSSPPNMDVGFIPTTDVQNTNVVSQCGSFQNTKGILKSCLSPARFAEIILNCKSTNPLILMIMLLTDNSLLVTNLNDLILKSAFAPSGKLNAPTLLCTLIKEMMLHSKDCISAHDCVRVVRSLDDIGFSSYGNAVLDSVGYISVLRQLYDGPDAEFLVTRMLSGYSGRTAAEVDILVLLVQNDWIGVSLVSHAVKFTSILVEYSTCTRLVLACKRIVELPCDVISSAVRSMVNIGDWVSVNKIVSKLIEDDAFDVLESSVQRKITSCNALSDLVSKKAISSTKSHSSIANSSLPSLKRIRSDEGGATGGASLPLLKPTRGDYGGVIDGLASEELRRRNVRDKCAATVCSILTNNYPWLTDGTQQSLSKEGFKRLARTISKDFMDRNPGIKAEDITIGLDKIVDEISIHSEILKLRNQKSNNY